MHQKMQKNTKHIERKTLKLASCFFLAKVGAAPAAASGKAQDEQRQAARLASQERREAQQEAGKSGKPMSYGGGFRVFFCLCVFGFWFLFCFLKGCFFLCRVGFCFGCFLLVGFCWVLKRLLC